ncbi:hypothetical protein EBS02_10800 [bacterium]|nr:hypothetical protein [bacterium]
MRILLTLLFILFNGHSYANEDQGLYNLPVEGSSFIRVINADTRDLSNVKINGRNILALKSYGASPYYGVTTNRVGINAGETKGVFNLVKNSYYSFIIKDKNITKLTDHRNDDITKAQITLYNLSSQDGISLKTSDGKIEIIKPVVKGKSDFRTLNPVSLSASIYNKKSVLKKLDPVLLENRAYYSVIVFSSKNILFLRSDTVPLP